MMTIKLRLNLDPLDPHIGMRIRMRRSEVGMTQEMLAERINVGRVQMRKYEIGENRVAASTLWKIANALGVAPGYFFQGYTTSGTSAEMPPDVTARISIATLRLMDEIDALPRNQRVAVRRVVQSMQNPGAPAPGEVDEDEDVAIEAVAPARPAQRKLSAGPGNPASGATTAGRAAQERAAHRGAKKGGTASSTRKR
jgi:transcriptional regulator with XRE-family HTH domain